MNELRNAAGYEKKPGSALHEPQAHPRLVIAGTGSGSGKTTVTLGLMRAFARRGLKVQGFKCGPDYIDPAYHTAVTGHPSRNLDSWMTSSDYLQEYFLQASADADLSVIEGVMGLYDGKEDTALTGSTAEIAILTASPVLLVVDVRSMGRSAAAIVLGFRQLEPQVQIAAVLVNRCGSEGHYRLVKAAIEAACGIPVIGWLPRDSGLDIPERHLGLLPAVERGELAPLFERAADMLEQGTDLERLLELAAAAPAVQGQPVSPEQEALLACMQMPDQQVRSLTYAAELCNPAAQIHKTQAGPAGPGPLIAVARDAAFNFYYADNLELLAREGAKLVYFSPLSGEGIPPEADGIYLGGGFPEEFAAVIAANQLFLSGLRSAAAAGMPLYAECGGYMVLARSLTDRNSRVHEMAGIVPAHTVMQERRAALGYREVTALHDCLLLKQGERLRGHEFHYSVMSYLDGEARNYAYESKGRGGSQPEGYISGSIMAAYAHIHLASHLPAAARLVAACRAYRDSKQAVQQHVPGSRNQQVE
ncbi:cobyrinic acid a,c-diamide synthase [Paenibacillus sp. FSL R7-277]|uniref:cobyrinate a,c-diamide synthase n=1 Tax=Paenibacillus sp. FSL R7-277 TaxID=1227352 RepID=UPI0003E20947|nr:cobyrinate a,c-diamide synthase [Paenibacillus sp. FSL R7-277]ETT77511.1 cobyrinic acid a,c-diamide synthase [Paenibacillus sp. FSL R7-277]